MKEIVIKMDNEHYERIMRLEEGVTVYPTTLALYEAVKNGTPLPKGHGRLIDADDLDTSVLQAGFAYALTKRTLRYTAGEVRQKIANAPTIIEADKEG